MKCSRLLGLAAMAVLFAIDCGGPALAQTHPMDALTATEIRATTAVLKADPRTKDAAYQLITLKEPAKADVLAWKPGAPPQQGPRTQSRR